MVKRFLAEPSSKRVQFITDHEDSDLYIATTYSHPEVLVEYDKRSSSKEDETYDLEDCIAIKGVSAVGNRFIIEKPKTFSLVEQEEKEDSAEIVSTDKSRSVRSENGKKRQEPKSAKKSTTLKTKPEPEGVKVDLQSEGPITIELDVEPSHKKSTRMSSKSEKVKKNKADSSDDEGQISLF